MGTMGRKRIGGFCAVAALGGLAGTAPAHAREPVAIATAADLGPVERGWSIDRGQFVPDLPDTADDAARRVFGSRFAGLHYWRGEGRRPVLAIHVVDATAADLPAVDRLLDSEPLRSVTTPVRLIPARLSERELEQGARALAPVPRGRIYGAGIDTMRNQVVVQTRPDGPLAAAAAAGRRTTPRRPSAGERRLVRRLGLPASAVRWETGSPPRTSGTTLVTEMTGIYGGTRIWIPKVGTNTDYGCTAGWAFTNRFGRFMTTAGHCGTLNAPVYRSIPGSGARGDQISNITTSDFNRTGGDVATYPAAFASARQFSGSDLRYVQAASSPQVGEWVCFQGASSQVLSCGSIAVVNYSYVPAGWNGATVGHQFCTDLQGPNASGDSGSAVWIPWFQNDQRKISLRGTLSAGGPGRICATDVATTLQQFAALPATEEPPCSG